MGYKLIVPGRGKRKNEEMAKVTWTFQALEGLNEIAEYQAKYAEKYASFFIDAIFDNTQYLETFPYSALSIIPNSFKPGM